LQFVRKLSGFNAPSRVNEAASNRAVEQVSAAATALIGSLVTLSPPRDREIERAKLALSSAKRFSSSSGRRNPA
jgi:hypothetical protein